MKKKLVVFGWLVFVFLLCQVHLNYAYIRMLPGNKQLPLVGLRDVDSTTIDDPNRYGADQPCIIGHRGFRGTHGDPGNTGDRGHQGTPGIFYTLVGNHESASNFQYTRSGESYISITDSVNSQGHSRVMLSTLMMDVDIACDNSSDCINGSSVALNMEFGFCECVLGTCPPAIKRDAMLTELTSLNCAGSVLVSNVTLQSSIQTNNGQGHAFISLQLLTPGSSGTGDILSLVFDLTPDPGYGNALSVYSFDVDIITIIYYNEPALYDTYFPPSLLDAPWNPIDLPK